MTGVDEAETGTDRPVLVCLKEVSASRRRADTLRGFGLRCRAFADAEAMINATAARPPAAIIASLSRGDRLQQAFADTEHPVERIGVLAEDDLKSRLRMAQAGFDACFPQPVNVTALLHHLRTCFERARARVRVALVGHARDDLLDTVAALPAAFEHRHFTPTPELLATLESYAPQLLVVDGDASRPAPALLVTALRQYPALAILPILLVTRGDKRRFDALAARVGLDGLVGLPLASRDLAAIARARIGQAERMHRTCQYLAHRDLLTGLFNRAHLGEALSHALTAQAGGGGIVALFHIEIDGRDGADPSAFAVAEAAEAVRRAVPPLAVAARIDDTAIGVLVAGAGESEVQTLEQRLRDGLSGGDHGWSANIGLALADGRFRSPTAFLERARGNARAGQDTSDSRQDVGAHWAPTVRSALTDNRFRLAYQPVSSLNGQPGSLFEVFVRLVDEHGREILPGEFIEAARAADLGPDLDRWVLGRAIDVLADENDTVRPDLFVKVLPETLAEDDFANWLCERLATEGVDGSRLILEIPHATLRQRRETVTRRRAQWAASGCRIALEYYDDERDSAPAADADGFDFIKLSPRITEGTATDPRRVHRIGRITAAARERQVRTVATLVQDAAELSTLWQAGVDYIQGYFMQAPGDVFGNNA